MSIYLKSNIQSKLNRVYLLNARNKETIDIIFDDGKITCLREALLIYLINLISLFDLRNVIRYL